jgi:hypothetical protein
LSANSRLPRRARRLRAARLALRSVIGGYAAFAGLNAQAAEPANVTAAFGNTVLSTYADGTSQKIWLRPDGRWDGLSRANSPLAGTWTTRGDKVCLKQSKPPTLPLAFCAPLPASARPGVQWTSRDIGGRAITLSLTKGVPAQFQAAEVAGRKASNP